MNILDILDGDKVLIRTELEDGRESQRWRERETELVRELGRELGREREGESESWEGILAKGE